ncbi:pyridine nucleotide-disulfide oxidoreductase [Krasilnikoviella flava]|uniref:Predicted flavoprotein CzcO associated with the cation diffusion facilitator CzcD n=1 Tax=Krasilnikoviella flava TaxID=526729 RepID=A0A1T5LZ28_9MICO|nr:pyridine nucleotide-disulfide oxidoreductase [Krasilnikoviella flava]SKC81133.1 Predicted flavoprotein CzcO associated with the cation diffusion facilitator CzcD [Krasilnikoviella flava]
MTRTVDTDYLVVGAGAAGMAFVDALVDHDPTAHATLVDRRDAAGGHWLDAYPFVRLHQASQFYGVASTRLGTGRVQESGPEQGLHERATGPEICSYYAKVLAERLLPTGRVELFGGHEYRDGSVVDLATGRAVETRVRRRVVDARYLAPSIPALTPPPFDVDDGARVVPVGALPDVGDAADFVVVGSGKTATDAVVWLLGRGVDPEAIHWVRPRDPWMLDRSVVQPDPAVFLGMAGTLMAAACVASSADDLFLSLEDAGVMTRIDPAVVPTMARTPTLGRWELELLRSVDRVVRAGHLRRVSPGRLVLDDGDVAVPHGAVVVHCAAYGLHLRPALPIWGERITLQSVRAGFPPFCAALVGFVEGTWHDRPDEEKNRLCPPTPYWSTPADWAALQGRGARAAATFMSDPDVAAWAHSVLLNPARVPPEETARPEVRAAVARYLEYAPAGIAGLERIGRDAWGRV